MDLTGIENVYTDIPFGSYRWYVGIYGDYFERTLTYVDGAAKATIASIFHKLRDEHTINWNRNYLYEFKAEYKEKVKALVYDKMHSTDRFDVLKVCLYLLRHLEKDCVLDDYVLRKIPELKVFLEDYVEPCMSPLQEKVASMSRSEHSLRDLEVLLITNRGFNKVMDHQKESYTGDRYHTTNLDCIELDLTADCNLKCFNCDRACGRAESTESMTVQQVEKFVEESKSCEKEWVRIGITGGEPTLHPNIMKIVGLLIEYRNTHLPKSSYVQVVSNGYGDAPGVLKRIESSYLQKVVPSNATNTFIRNNNKRNKVVLHSPVNMAPVDDERFKGCDFRNGCWVTETTGLCLNRYGYYGCGAGAAIDRVFGYDLGIKALKDVCMSRIIEQRKKLCALCGRFNDLSITAEYYGPGWVVEEKASVTWEKVFGAYQKNKPVLTIY
jgi:hypothetical protein